MIEESKSNVSHSEMGSPRDFQSDISATPKGAGPMGLNIQTPKGNIGGRSLPQAPTSTTNASSARMGIDMAGGVMPPQTPGGLGGKVPALDMAKVVGSGGL